jgi:general secretion pathway protein H
VIRRSIPPRNGFSLVELMVVVFVMALLAGVVVLSLPGDQRLARDEAQRFAARTLAARDEAISGGRAVALVVSGAGYYFEVRRGGSWAPLDPARFGLVGWKPGTVASLAGGMAPAFAPGDPTPSAAAPARERIVFDPVGLASSDAQVRIARGGSALAVRIARDGSVSVDAAS